jgi:hypothetical protein
MSRPKIADHNSETNEMIVREMTEAEYAQYQEDIAAAKAIEDARLKRLDDKAALLERLGITADEAALLLG